jgi:hypothetical protein
MKGLVPALVITGAVVLVAVAGPIIALLWFRHKCRSVGLGKPDWLFRDDTRTKQPVPQWLRGLDKRLDAEIRHSRQKENW